MTSPLPPGRPGIAYVSSPVVSMVLMATKWGRATHPDHRTPTREQVIEGTIGGAITGRPRGYSSRGHKPLNSTEMSSVRTSAIPSPHPHFWTDPGQCRQAKCASEFPNCDHLLRLPLSSEKFPSFSALPVPGPVHLRLLHPGGH